MEPVRNSSNLNSLRKLHNMRGINVRSLRNLGVTSSSFQYLLNLLLLKLLHHGLVIEYHKKRNPDNNSDEADLIAFLKCEIECRGKAFFPMTNSKNHAITSFAQKNKTENRQRKISNKSPHGNTFNTNVKFFSVFRKNNDYVSSECKNLADDKKKGLMLKMECLESHISHKIASMGEM